MKSITLDLFALGVANVKKATPIRSEPAKLNLDAIADIARFNVSNSKKSK